MAWKRGEGGSLVFYEDGREPTVFPAGSITDADTLKGIEAEIGPSAPGGPTGPGLPAPIAAAPEPVAQNPLPPEEIAARQMVAGGLDTIGGIANKGRDLPIVGYAAGAASDLASMGSNALKGTLPPAGGVDPAAPAGLPAPVAPQAALGDVAKNFPQPAPPKPAGPSPLQSAFNAQDKAIGAEKAAAQTQSDIASFKAGSEKVIVDDLNAKLADHETQAEIQRKTMQAAIEDSEKKYTEAVESFAKMKVDPDHYMSSRSAGQKFGLVLASIIGGLGQALTGKENAGTAAINREIDRDLSIQKDAIMNAREGASMKGNLVAQMRQKGLSFEQATLAAKQVMLEGAKRQLDGISAEFKSPEIDAQNKMVQAQLDKQLSDLRVSRSLMLAKAAGAGAGRHLNEGTAKELGEANAAVKSARDLLGKFESSHSDGIGGWLKSWFPANDTSRYENNAAVATQVIGTYLEGGKLSDANVPQYRAMLPKPGDGKETAQNKINALVDLIGTRQAHEKRALAGSGFDVGGIADAKKDVGFRAAQ